MRTLYPAKLKSQSGKEVEIPLDLGKLKVREGDQVITVGSDTVWQVVVLGEAEKITGKHHRHWIVRERVK